MITECSHKYPINSTHSHKPSCRTTSEKVTRSASSGVCARWSHHHPHGECSVCYLSPTCFAYFSPLLPTCLSPMPPASRISVPPSTVHRPLLPSQELAAAYPNRRQPAPFKYPRIHLRNVRQFGLDHLDHVHHCHHHVDHHVDHCHFYVLGPSCSPRPLTCMNADSNGKKTGSTTPSKKRKQGSSTR